MERRTSGLKNLKNVARLLTRCFVFTARARERKRKRNDSGAAGGGDEGRMIGGGRDVGHGFSVLRNAISSTRKLFVPGAENPLFATHVPVSLSRARRNVFLNTRSCIYIYIYMYICVCSRILRPCSVRPSFTSPRKTSYERKS